MTMELDTNTLFRERTVEEIQALSSRFNHEIGEKRQELRMMVGERYRDLIIAADTITQMKIRSSKIVESVSELKKRRRRLVSSASSTTVKDNDVVDVETPTINVNYCRVAAQIKLLMDIPEMIWSAIESNSNYLLAAQLYLFARHVHTNLMTVCEAELTNQFPVIDRQWEAAAHFHVGIVNGCENKLRSVDLSRSDEVLATLVLLKGLDSGELFREFLKLRKQSLEEVLKDVGTLTAKEYISRILKLIISTLEIIHSAFVEGGLTKALGSSCDQPTLVYFSTKLSPVFKYLPGVIAGFKPGVSKPLSELSETDLNLTMKWLDESHDDIVSRTGEEVLTHVGSIEGLAIIRQQIYDLLKSQNHGWDGICQALLNRKLSLWDEFFRNVFRERVEAIVESKITGSIYTVQSNLGSLNDSGTEIDLSWYVWSETAQNDDLSMKARAFSPKVQKMCSEFDSTLEALLKDLEFYVVRKDNFQTFVVEDDEKSIEPFCLDTDNETLLSFLQEILISKLDELMIMIKKFYNEKNDLGVYLFIGRFYQAFPELTPSTVKAVTFVSSVKEQIGQGYRRSLNPLLDSKWIEIKSKLEIESNEAFNLWKNGIISKLKTDLADSLRDERKCFLSLLPSWDTITISEESDDGVIESKIFVPQQPSVNLMTSLNKYCHSVYTVGPQSLPNQVQNSLSQDAASALINVYADLKWPKITQNVALQLYFDVKFIAQCMISRENEKVCSSVLSILENHIDPFDLDVFQGHIATRVKLTVLRDQCLLGTLIPADRYSLLASLKSSIPTTTTSTNKDHNSLPTAVNQKYRFPLLPVPTTTKKKAYLRDNKGLSADNVDNQRTSLASRNSKQQQRQSRDKSPRPNPASFFGAMSSSWFGGK